MVDIKAEIESIRNLLVPILPNVKFDFQNMRKEHLSNTFAIDFELSKSATETNASYRLDHTIQLVYFGASALDCLSNMAKVEQIMNNEMHIPINGTTRYLSIGSFSLSKPFATETNGVYAIIGMLEVSLRELRPQPTYDKMENIYYDVIGVPTQAPCNKNLKGVIL